MAISEQEYAGFWGTLTGKGGADEGVIGGRCTDHTGLLGKKGAQVSCADLRAAQEGKPKGTYTSYTSIPDAPKSGGSSTSGLKTGNYAESGYTYFYNASTKAVTIVMSPKGGTNIAVSKGSKAYDAIIDAIKSGKAKPVSSEKLKEERSKKPQVPASVPAKEIVSQAAETLPASQPFYTKTWFMVAAPLTLAAVIGLGIMFWPKKD